MHPFFLSSCPRIMSLVDAFSFDFLFFFRTFTNDKCVPCGINKCVLFGQLVAIRKRTIRTIRTSQTKWTWWIRWTPQPLLVSFISPYFFFFYFLFFHFFTWHLNSTLWSRFSIDIVLALVLSKILNFLFFAMNSAVAEGSVVAGRPDSPPSVRELRPRAPKPKLKPKQQQPVPVPVAVRSRRTALPPPPRPVMPPPFVALGLLGQGWAGIRQIPLADLFDGSSQSSSPTIKTYRRTAAASPDRKPVKRARKK